MVLAIGRAISLLLSGLGVLASLTSPSVFVLPSIPKIFCTAISANFALLLGRMTVSGRLQLKEIFVLLMR